MCATKTAVNRGIRKLSDREHLLQRPAMYIGSVDTCTSMEYVQDGTGVQYREVRVVPGMLKIINEIIDNSVDVAIKSGFTHGLNISVKMTDTVIEVKDDGTGIPVQVNADGDYLPRICWGEPRSGSNFDDDDNRTQIGMNGVGSYCCNVFSTSFTGTTDDGNAKYRVRFVDNASDYVESVSPSTGKTGTTVTFTPDLGKFSVSEISPDVFVMVRQRLLNLSMSFPDIRFKFNGKRVTAGSFRKYVELFSKDYVIHETDDYRFAVLPNDNDDFRQLSYVNGLKIPDGGTHIDVIVNTAVGKVRDKLVKKYKTIKPGDIRNKIMIIAFLRNFKNPKFNSQTKEKITNSVREVNEYYSAETEIPYDALCAKIMRTPAIVDPITEVYRIKEEFKRRQELSALNRPKKRIKSDKYYPSIGVKKYLVLAEGESAAGSLIPTLGRRECGYYCLKGVPLNAYSAAQSKFTNNKELSELYTIIRNEEYEHIVIGADADCDGSHIIGLLFGFFKRYLPELLNGRVGILKTPVVAVKNAKKKLTGWSYSLDPMTLKRGEISHYKKGLGSWDSDELKEIVRTDGLQNMITIMNFDSDLILEEWLGDSSEPRKIHILGNDFSIAHV